MYTHACGARHHLPLTVLSDTDPTLTWVIAVTVYGCVSESSRRAISPMQSPGFSSPIVIYMETRCMHAGLASLSYMHRDVSACKEIVCVGSTKLL